MSTGGRSASQGPVYSGYPQRCPNFVETASSKSTSAFPRSLEKGDKVIEWVDVSTGMMSPDEWIHYGLEFEWKSWECRSED